MEKQEERKFRLWCERQGYLCLKLAITGRRGWPDRTVITPEVVLFMEFKTPTGRLSAQQVYWIELLAGYPSCKVFVPRSAEQAIELVNTAIVEALW